MATFGKYDPWTINGSYATFHQFYKEDNNELLVERNDGSKVWYKNGKTHRDNDLPAVEHLNGNKYWYKRGRLHREGGFPAVVEITGKKQWWINGQRHRDNDLPAVEWTDTPEELKVWVNDCIYKEWWKNGKHHRDGDLPAIEQPDGTKSWYVNGELHRNGGLPAIEYADGNKYWFVNGQLHREDGPAIECNGDVSWHINGKQLSTEQVDIYTTFCKKIEEKRKIRAQKIIYYWWIPICYDMKRECGKRMAQRSLKEYENMIS